MKKLLQIVFALIWCSTVLAQPSPDNTRVPPEAIINVPSTTYTEWSLGAPDPKFPGYFEILKSGRSLGTVRAKELAYCQGDIYALGRPTSGKGGWWRIAANLLWTNTVTLPCDNMIPPPVTNTLTVTKTGTGSGVVTSTGINCGTDCTEVLPQNTQVILTAVAASGSTFAGWSANCPNGGIVLTANTTCIAIFNLLPTTGFTSLETALPIVFVGDTAILSLNLATAGTYIVWTEVLAPSGAVDSYFVSMDGGAEDIFDVAENKWSTNWQWSRVNGRGTTAMPLTLDPRTFALTVGQHTLKFRVRDVGSQARNVMLTTNPTFSPGGVIIPPPPPPAGPVITMQPQNVTVAVNGTVTFSVAASGSGLSYQWRKTGANIPGATNPNYTTAPATLADTGTRYSVVISNPSGSVTSADAILTVQTGTPPPPPPPPTGDKEVRNVTELQSVLSGKGVLPGETIYLRAGTYTTGCPAGQWTSLATGTQAAPITIRAYPGERVTIDGGFAIGNQDGTTGGWTIFRDLEFTSLCNGNRFGHENMAGQTDILASNVKLINNIMHDRAQGIGSWSVGQNAELYGNIIYNYGYEDENRGHGHAIYLQNDQGAPTKVVDNIMFNGFSEQIHAYTQAGQIRRFYFEGNTVFNPGALAVRPITNYIADNVFFGSHSASIESLIFTKNYLYNEPGKGGAGLNLGTQYQAVNNVGTITDNWLMGFGGRGIWTNLTFTGNKFWCGYCQYPAMITTPEESPNNTFYPGRPTGTDIFVRPNQYEAKRANITIYNWDKTPTVAVNVSGVLNVGDPFEVRDVHNYFGPPVVTGVYNGQPISIPMVGPIALPIGTGYRTPIHTGPEFGAFVVKSTVVVLPGPLVPPPPPPPPPPTSVTPVAQWKFDDGSGAVATDSSGNNNHGTLVNGAGWGEGKFGGALVLDGAGGHVKVMDSATLSITGDLTISGWIWPDNIAHGRQEIIARRYTNEYELMLELDARFDYWHGDGVEENFLMPHSFSAVQGTWNHFVVTRSISRQTINFYLNGVAAGEAQFSKLPVASVNNVFIGARFGTEKFFKGRMDDIRLYNRALSPTEVQAVFQGN